MIIQIPEVDQVTEITEDVVNVHITEQDYKVVELSDGSINVIVSESDVCVKIEEALINVLPVEEVVKIIEIGGPTIIKDNPPNIQNSYTAGEAIGAYKAVKLETDGLLYLADNSVPSDIFKTIGISISSATAGGSVQVVEHGFKQNNILNTFSPGVVFVGSSGALTQVKPSSGFAKKLGFIIQPGEIHVQVRQGTILN